MLCNKEISDWYCSRELTGILRTNGMDNEDENVQIEWSEIL